MTTTKQFVTYDPDGTDGSRLPANVKTEILRWAQGLDPDLTALAALTTPATKLSGIATGATANDTDENLKNRANHTGTQTSSTISDFTEAVQDAVAGVLAAGTNVTLTYNDAGNSLTIDATGGGGGLNAEAVRD